MARLALTRASVPQRVVLLILAVAVLGLGTLVVLGVNFVQLNRILPETDQSATELPLVAALRNEVLRFDALTSAELGLDLPNLADLVGPRDVVANRREALQAAVPTPESEAEQELYALAFARVDELLQIYDAQVFSLGPVADSTRANAARLELRRAFDESETALDALYLNQEAKFIATTSEAAIIFRAVQAILVGASVMIIIFGAVLMWSLRQSVQTELGRAYERQQVAAAVGRAASSILNLDELYFTTLALICERFNYYHAALFLLDEAGRYAVLREAVGGESQKLKEQGLQVELGSTSLIGGVLADRMVRVAADVTTHPQYRKHALLPATRSEIVLPLQVGERLLGVLDVHATTRNAFQEADAIMLQALADQVAVAINNAARYSLEQTRAEQMAYLSETALDLTTTQDPAATMELITQRAARLIHGENVSLWLAAPGTTGPAPLELSLTANIATGAVSRVPNRQAQADREVARQVFESGRAFRRGVSNITTETGQVIGTGNAVLAVPLTSPSHPLGVLVITKAPHSRYFTGEDERVAQLFATQAAATLENIRLLSESRRRATQLAVSAEVARVATTLQDLPALLKLAAEVISERFGFYHVGLFLIDDTREWAILRAANSVGGQRMLGRAHRLRVGQQGIVGFVTSTGQPRIALDVGADAVHFQNPDLPETHSEMALPLLARGTLIGALDVQSVETNAFTPDDIAVLQTLADQLAVAIENARLFAETRRSLDELRALQAEARKSVAGSGADALTFRYDGVSIQPATQFPSSADSFHFPIHVGDAQLGTLAIKRSLGEWLPEDAELAQAVAERMALALENARLFETTRATLAQTARLYNASRDIAAAHDMETILRTVLMHALEAHYRRFVIGFIEVDWRQQVTALTWTAAWDQHLGAQYHLDQRYTPDELPILKLITPHAPLRLPALTAPDMDDQSRAVFEPQGLQALTLVPLVAAGELLAVFMAATSQPHIFSDEELRPLQALADQTAIAIQNLRLLERTRQTLDDTRRRAEREQTIANISARLQGGTAVQSVLQIAVEELRRATGSARAVARLGHQRSDTSGPDDKEAA